MRNSPIRLIMVASLSNTVPHLRKRGDEDMRTRCRNPLTFPQLKQAMTAASKRSQSLVEDADRLRAVTGLGDNAILDLVLSALDDEQKARAALAVCGELPETNKTK